MTSLLLAATLLCPVSMPAGGYTVGITAKYLHEAPGGGQYEFNGLELYTTPVPVETHIVAEGHPWYVSVSKDGVLLGQCSAGPAIMVDGFEMGTTGEWSRP